MKLNIEAPFTNLSSHTITDNATIIYDGFIDAAKAIRKRPGLGVFLDLTGIAKYTSAPIDGSYWFNDISAYIFCCAGDVIKVTDKFGTYSIIGTGVLTAGEPVTFAKCANSAASNIATLFMANGGQIAYTTGSSVSNLSGTNIPNRVTHVAAVNGYLIANDLDNPTIWKHSDALTPLTWSSGFAYSAQSKTDAIQGLFEAKGKVFIFGESSIEPFYDSGFAIPFQRIDGGVMETGCVNPYSFGKIGSDVYLLNSERDIVYIPAGSYSPVVLSDAYASRLRELSTVNDVKTDCIVSSGGRKYVLFNFKDAGITIVFDPQSNAFYEWGHWLSDENRYERFLGQSYTYSPEWNYNLIGHRSAGIIYRIEEAYKADGSDPIRHQLETGNYDFGDITKVKQIQNLQLHVDRGEGLDSDPDNVSAKAFLDVIFDFAQSSLNPTIEVDLGRRGETPIIDTSLQGGIFRTIRFKITHMDESSFALCGIYLNYGVNG